MTGESGHDDSETPDGMGDEEELTRGTGETSGRSGWSSTPSHLGGSTSGTNSGSKGGTQNTGGSTTGRNSGGTSGNR
jgi:hypothetical protein